jgi:hypothetical protein
MLEYSELTVVKNSSGIATALGFPINSFLLQNNKALFAGGGKKSYENLAVPAGLVCMTETICKPANEMANEIANEMAYEIAEEEETIPDGLYERLMELAETKPMKKMTKRKMPTSKKMKQKSRKTKK